MGFFRLPGRAFQIGFFRFGTGGAGRAREFSQNHRESRETGFNAIDPVEPGADGDCSAEEPPLADRTPPVVDENSAKAAEYQWISLPGFFGRGRRVRVRVR